MKVAFLAGQNSIHTVRWANAMVEKVSELHLLTMHQPSDPIDRRVKIYNLPNLGLPGYFLNVGKTRQLLKKIQPDLLHVHYASGYGTLGRLSKFHPLLLSVWGSDVYDFPAKSGLHRALVANNLREADWIGSTSQVMAAQTRSLLDAVAADALRPSRWRRRSEPQPLWGKVRRTDWAKPCALRGDPQDRAASLCDHLPHLSITPFGIDVTKFAPRPQQDPDYITVGTVKRLKPKYGIDILIKAFAQARTTAIAQDPDLGAKLRLLIVGDGKQQAELESLAAQLDIESVTTFTGGVPHEEVPNYLNQMDIYVAASRLDSESFGVAVLEASACELPVVVSDAGGLPEVVESGVTGYIAPKENVAATATAIGKLIGNPTERGRLGKAGRKLVLENYVWSENVELMYEIYGKVLESNRLSQTASS